jgi:hypothetical protein
MTRGAPSPNSPTREKSRFEQIQVALGHESIQTTERYLGVQREVTCQPFTRRVSAVFGLVSDTGRVSD